MIVVWVVSFFLVLWVVKCAIVSGKTQAGHQKGEDEMIVVLVVSFFLVLWVVKCVYCIRKDTSQASKG